MGTSLKNFNDTCQHSRKKRPEPVGTPLRALKINTVILLKSSAGSDTADSNSSKTVANSSETLPDLEFFGLSEFFRQSHVPPSLPDRHQRPHSLAQRLHDLRHVQVHLVRHLLLVPTRARFLRLILTCVYVNSHQISRKKISGKRQTNNFRSVAAFSVDILGLWTVSRATAIILSWQKLSKKVPRDISRVPERPLQVQAAN